MHSRSGMVVLMLAVSAGLAAEPPEFPAEDCNENGVRDSQDIADGISQDCDLNGVPDECDVQPRFEDRAVALGLDAYRALSVCAADIDGDDDTDILSASGSAADRIAWYENLDGAGNFGPQILIDSGSPSIVRAPDLDGDGDPDVLSTFTDEQLIWYENLDGQGTFSPRKVISPEPGEARSIFTADLDDDGDLDVLAVSFDKIAWYENLDGEGDFGGPQIIIQQDFVADSAVAADLDGDEDLDVLSATRTPGNTVAWYENLDGLGSFGRQQLISAQIEDPLAVRAADLDGDGDQDVLSGHLGGAAIVWYENLDGAATFGAPRFIATVAVWAIHVGDLDSDGDSDVLYASLPNDTIAWHENLDGLGSFGPQQVVSTSVDEAVDVFTAEINGDGVTDVVSAGRGPGDNSNCCLPNGGPACSDFDCASEVCLIDPFCCRVAWDEVCADEALTFPVCVEGCAAIEPAGIAWHQNLGLDCNGNGVPDPCDTLQGSSLDCDANLVPDECRFDCNAGGVIESCDTCNGNGLADTCETVCPTCNADDDSCPDDLDCAPADGTLWSQAGPVENLQLNRSGATTTLGWQPPRHVGARSVSYDLLRSAVASDFFAPAICLESGDTDLVAEDRATPDSGQGFHYLVRVENGCPGPGAMGNGSNGVPRTGVACP